MPFWGHREAERQLAQGLSPGARGCLGAAAIGAGLLAALSAESTPRSYAVYGLAAFFWAIALACFAKGIVRQIAGRIIGAVVFLTAAGYLYSQVTDGSFVSGVRSEPSVLNAILSMLAFGLPGAYYAVRGRWRDTPVDDESEVAVEDGEDGER